MDTRGRRRTRNELGRGHRDRSFVARDRLRRGVWRRLQASMAATTGIRQARAAERGLSIVVDPDSAGNTSTPGLRAPFSRRRRRPAVVADGGGIINAAQVSAGRRIDPSAPLTLYTGTGRNLQRHRRRRILGPHRAARHRLRAARRPVSDPHLRRHEFRREALLDGGSTWTGDGPVNQFVFALAPDLSSRLVYAGTDGGVFTSSDGATGHRQTAE
jgi:hypothetical protein